MWSVPSQISRHMAVRHWAGCSSGMNTHGFGSWVSCPGSPGRLRAEIVHVPSGHSERGQGEGSAPGWLPAAPLPCSGLCRTFPYWMSSSSDQKLQHKAIKQMQELGCSSWLIQGVGMEGEGSSAGFDLPGSTAVVPDAHLSHL